ncbi:hypothetical protein [Formosa haliotis]|uniref:hypothetical protein n=1 Tax=Formosa haliotis TaxID=1555194 RepID=UPI0008240ABD|nr:hypothetical protein [Formosa haliotis]
MKKYIVSGFVLFSLIYLFYNIITGYPKGIKNTLNIAGVNEEEYIAVLDHFSKRDKDSLKFKAAKSLISNIPFYSFKNTYLFYNNLIDSLERTRQKQVKENLEPRKIRDYTRENFFESSKLISEKNRELKKNIKDIDVLNSNF